MKIYKVLHEKYGAQGWWPFTDGGYHSDDYIFPKNENQIFEICLGVILTQNTTFTSVVKSLNSLSTMNCLDYKAIKKMPLDMLKSAIKPSGYFNQKANYILAFIKFFERLEGGVPTREELLAVKGIGPESADSILLYAYKQPEFVVDAYTKRLLLHAGLIDEKASYLVIKKFMESEIEKELKDRDELLICYQEFHALIVAHAKLFYSKKPYGIGCFL
ncbi:MAG: endonuclease III domain-containing protein [Campylobacterales bacterium]|nr:endonuclease III domain-containing protein [Campylobacterales bacterium]